MDDESHSEGGLSSEHLLLGVGAALGAGALVVVLLVAVLLAPLAAFAAGGMGSGPSGCPPEAGDACLNPSGDAVVAVALEMAAHLHRCPPSGMDVCYDAGFPPAVLAYWQRTCPRCGAWRNGNLQCVMLVLGAYGVAGDPPPAAGNAIAFWSLYRNRPGWVEIPSGWGDPRERRLPAPGDMMVWYNAGDPGVGHIAIVAKVEPPVGGQEGQLTIVEANGPGAIITHRILPDLTVPTWRGYTVVGFIRHPGRAPAA
jgi:hypothetical protein